MNNLLLSTCSELDINLTALNVEQFSIYKNFLLDWNKNVNLTAIREEKDIVIKHFVDSLSVYKVFDFKHGSSVVDIGTGAGFPGIPLKIVRPDLKLTLIDSLNKRIIFLNSLISKLNLDNVTCFHKRAEDCGCDNYFREKFDFCVSRAVAPLNVLCEYAVPLIKVNGYFIAYKGSDVSLELSEASNAIEKLGCKLFSVNSLLLPESCIKRNIIVIKKLRHTLSIYPRKQALIKRNPL